MILQINKSVLHKNSYNCNYYKYLQSVKLATPANVVIGTLGISLSFILIGILIYFSTTTCAILKVKKKVLAVVS